MKHINNYIAESILRSTGLDVKSLTDESIKRWINNNIKNADKVKFKILGNSFEIGSLNDEIIFTINTDFSTLPLPISKLRGYITCDGCDMNKIDLNNQKLYDLVLRNCTNLNSLINISSIGDLTIINCDCTDLSFLPKKIKNTVYIKDCNKLTSINISSFHKDKCKLCIVIEKCNNLRNLEGSPKIMYDSISIYDCEKLESLKGCPEEFNSKGHEMTSFNIINCKNLHSLKYAPEYIDGALNVSHSGIKNFKYLKTGSGSIDNIVAADCLELEDLHTLFASTININGCPKLKSLKGINTDILDTLVIGNTSIEDFGDIKHIKDLYVDSHSIVTKMKNKGIKIDNY